MEQERSYFTHYLNDQEPLIGLRKLVFLTATESGLTKGEHHWAYSVAALLTENLQPQFDDGSLIPLRNQAIEADGKQILWMDQNRGIWAADNEHPEKDLHPHFIEGPEGYVTPQDLPLQFRLACEGTIKDHHFISATCKGRSCQVDGCKEPAAHKVAEEIPEDDPLQIRHEFTCYVCCGHFRQIMGSAVFCPKE